MAVSVLNRAQDSDRGDAGATINLTVPATTSGKILVVYTWSSGGTAPTAPTAPSGGWTQGTVHTTGGVSSKQGRFQWRPNNGSGITTVTWVPTAGASNDGIYYWELDGVDQTTPLDVQGVDSTGTSNTPTASSITPTKTNGIKLVGCTIANASGTLSVGAGYSQFRAGSLGFSGVEELLNPSGANAATFSDSASDDWGVMSVIFVAAPSGGPYRRMPQIKVIG